MTLSTVSYNCKGFASSVHYIIELLKTCNVLCLTETWLRPEELHVIDSIVNNCAELSDHQFTVYAKSSMIDIDSDQLHRGRPFGGLAIICKSSAQVTFNEIQISSSRVQAVCVSDANGNALNLLCNVYMPYFCTEMTDEYVCVLDHLQALLDNPTNSCPIKLFGDFNAQLPQAHTLMPRWERARGFNSHSKLLHDFLTTNNLVACDFSTRQTSNFTYFCLTRDVYSWIDHVFCTAHDLDCVKSCTILPLCAENISDHLPLVTEFTLNAAPHRTLSAAPSRGYARPSWKDPRRVQKYTDLVQEKLLSIPALPTLASLSSDDAQALADNRMKMLCSVLHTAAREAGTVPKRIYAPKRFWCPELSQLRDRKRFWWSLWTSCGRPRTGAVFDCWKSAKKVFRRMCRFATQDLAGKRTRVTNSLFKAKKWSSFWTQLKGKRPPIVSTLTANDLATSFKATMTDDASSLSVEQRSISDSVDERLASLKDAIYAESVSQKTLREAILHLKMNSSPGPDGVTAEHLHFAQSVPLLDCLAELMSLVLSKAVIPAGIKESIIVPVLKKPTLDPNAPSSYRPITLSSVFAKILETLIMPQIDHDLAGSQFGFRPGRDTVSACSFLHDLTAFAEDQGSPLYLCSLDAEKCFDKIWHNGLFYKLIDVLPQAHWRVLLLWYRSSTAAVRWNNVVSTPFHPTRGTKQGSVISPLLFNVYVNDLLLSLQENQLGFRIGQHSFSHVAYADDVTLVAAQPDDLQALINKCTDYADKWRFTYGLKKTTCMIIGRCPMTTLPSWELKGEPIKVAEEMTILGISLPASPATHVANRVSAARRSIFGFAEAGSLYPGLCTEAKVHIWKTVALPVLRYGLEAIDMPPASTTTVEKCQATLIKRCLGMSKYSHHSHVLSALRLEPVMHTVRQSSINLFIRLFNVDSPARLFNSLMLSRFMLTNAIPKGTLLHRLLTHGFSPMNLLLTKNYRIDPHSFPADGFIDSLRFLLLSENYVKPWSSEFITSCLFTNVF